MPRKSSKNAKTENIFEFNNEDSRILRESVATKQNDTIITCLQVFHKTEILKMSQNHRETLVQKCFLVNFMKSFRTAFCRTRPCDFFSVLYSSINIAVTINRGRGGGG